MDYQWLDLFKTMGRRIFHEVKKIAGTEEAKQILGKGAGGDVTVFIDKMAEDIVIEELKRFNVPCMLLSEEIGIRDFGNKLPIVVVDPIDGSLNAKRGIPYYAFSIALSRTAETGGLTVGYVLNIPTGEEFSAIRGKGALLSDVTESFSKHIVNESKNFSFAACEGIDRTKDVRMFENIVNHFHRVRIMGSTALDMCYLSTGFFDVFIHSLPSRVVDWSAAGVILKETGGIMIDIKGLEFSLPLNLCKSHPFFALKSKKDIQKILKIMNV
ncbi:MAG: inositol monophosphatase family protein [Campylobacterota bacterium]|nr:inositol monophosphatase family protein [Campylobacterota bacterium]